MAEDRNRLQERLRAVVARADVREALFLASPDLEEAIPLWEADPDGERGRGLTRALVRYLARMAGRPTPFGLFAGCSVGTLGERTRLEFGAGGTGRRSRLSVDYLSALAEEARATAEPGQLMYRPNQSLYGAAGMTRWIESRSDGAGCTAALVGVPAGDRLNRVLECARPGATLEKLASILTGEGMGADEARGYVEGLVVDQVLVAELVPPVTGPEPLGVLVAELGSLRGTSRAGERLAEAALVLDGLDAFGLGNPPSTYRGLAEKLGPMPAGVGLGGLFHVELVKSSPGATLGPAVVSELQRAARILHRLAPPGPAARMRRFRLAFAERFGGREMPLTEVLDFDTGIGFGPRATTAPPIEAILGSSPSPAEPTLWSRREEALVPRLVAAASTGARQIDLSDADLDEMEEASAGAGCYGLSVVATVSAESDDDLDRGRFLVLVRALSGPSGAGLLARFCHGDPLLDDHVRRLVGAEEALDADAVFADVVHLPPGRLGNVVLRPALRGYEIPYLGRSGLPADHQIPVDDLMVALAGNQIVLRSRRLGRRIVPRITNAHSFSRSSLPLYRFLGALQSDAAFMAWWDWGRLSAQPFLPRVTAGRLVLAPARWRVGGDDLERFRDVRDAGDAALFGAVQDWRAALGLPRLVAVGEGGEGLIVDLDNVLCADALVHLLVDRHESVVEELVAQPGELCARGPQGRFASEVIVPFLCHRRETDPSPPLVLAVETRRKRRVSTARTAGKGAAAAQAGKAAPEDLRRNFPPGSEWLQAELYGPATAADRVLCEMVGPLARRALDAGTADSWFFIRWFTPGTLLRVRFHGEGSRLREQVQPALEAAVESTPGQGWLVSRLVLGTYEREIERYGGPRAMCLSERVFAADSEAALDLLGTVPGGDDGLRRRWHLALGGSAQILADLGLALADRLEVVGALRGHTASLTGTGTQVNTELGRKFRREREAVEALVEDPSGGDAVVARALATRSATLAPVVAGLRTLQGEGQLSVGLADLAAIYVHLHVNRMLRSEHRAQELVLYDFLARVYRSQAARRLKPG